MDGIQISHLSNKLTQPESHIELMNRPSKQNSYKLNDTH